MDLFVIENYVCKPTPEILLIHPFKEIWESDKDPKKGNALKDFTYINFMCSTFTTNPFRNELSEEIKSKKIIYACFKGDYEIKPLVEKAIEIIQKDFLTEMSSSYRLLRAAKRSIQKITNLLNTYDPDERNKSGMLVFKPTDMVRVQSSLSASVDDLKKLEKTVEQEYKEKGKTMSNKTINPLERKPQI